MSTCVSYQQLNVNFVRSLSNMLYRFWWIYSVDLMITFYLQWYSLIEKHFVVLICKNVSFFDCMSCDIVAHDVRIQWFKVTFYKSWHYVRERKQVFCNSVFLFTEKMDGREVYDWFELAPHTIVNNVHMNVNNSNILFCVVSMYQ